MCTYLCAYLLSYADVWACVCVYLFAYESRRLLTFQLETSREIYKRVHSIILYPVIKLEEADMIIILFLIRSEHCSAFAIKLAYKEMLFA